MKDFLEFLNSRRQRGQAIVLATVVETSGSTYSKSGERLLIDADGQFRGLLSGGCLEGDLGLRTRDVIESGRARLVTYDLANDDDLWGMGVGCEGAITVLLQPLTTDNGYEPLASVLELLDGDGSGLLVTLIEESHGQALGDALLLAEAGDRCFGLPRTMIGGIRKAVASLPANAGGHVSVIADGQPLKFHCVRLEPPLRLLILGAAPDAAPLLRFANELGWRCTIADHRPAYLADAALSSARQTLEVVAAELSRGVDLGRFDAAVIMSHHLDSDREYLRQLAASPIGYIGLLGPPARRDRLIGELGKQAAPLERRLHAPAGLDFGGRGAAAIALSIVAEIQQFMQRRS